MKKSDTERDVLALAGEIVRNFYVDNDFSSLISSLSDDALVSLKNGVIISGKDDMEDTLNKSALFPCKIEKEEKNLKNLNEDLYLASIVTVLTSSEFTGSRTIRAEFVIRANKNNSSEILSLSFAQMVESSVEKSAFPAERKPARKTRGAAREEMLINFILDGLSNKEIAKRLSLAEITIKKALSKIYQRFGVKNRSELLTKISKK